MTAQTCKKILKKSLTLACLGWLLPLPAWADSLYKLVGFDCQQKEDRLLITYDVTYSEEMTAHASPTQWNPWSLLDFDPKDDRWISHLRTAQGECRLSDGVYHVSIVPAPDNYNIQGRCGANVEAAVKVEKDGQILFDKPLVHGCHEAERPAIQRVILRPGRAPVLRETSSHGHLAAVLSYTCQPQADTLRFDYAFVENDYLGPDLPRPDYNAPANVTVSIPADQLPELSETVIPWQSRCALKDGDYVFRLSGAKNRGACGTVWENVRLEISKNGQPVFDQPLAGDCQDPQRRIITQVIVRSGKPIETQSQTPELFDTPKEP